MSGPIVKVELHGVEDLVNTLKALPERIEKNVLRYALRTAAKPILTGAKIRAPKKSGAMAKSLAIRAFKRSRKQRVGFTIGTKASVNVFVGKAFYAGFQELGWKAGKRTKGQKWAKQLLNEEKARWRNSISGAVDNTQEKIYALRQRLGRSKSPQSQSKLIAAITKLEEWQKQRLAKQVKRDASLHRRNLTQAKLVVARDTRKKIPGLHFIKRSFNEHAEKQKNELEKHIRDGILREAEKAKK